MIRILGMVFVSLLHVSAALAQERVLVLPFEFTAMTPVSALEMTAVKALEEAAVNGLAKGSLTVIAPKSKVGEQEINLYEHRQRCAEDVLCLVQVGELLGATRLVVGEVRRGMGRTDKLRINLIDVNRATLLDSLRWDVPYDGTRLKDAVETAIRQLLIPADTTVLFDVLPQDASISIYGRRRPDIPVLKSIPFWSGVYRVSVGHPGYESKELDVTLASGDASRVKVHLELDPLYVRPSGEINRVTSRPRINNGKQTNSAFANIWAWAGVGVGAIAAGVGGAYMISSQGEYNDLALESRDFVNSESISDAETTARMRTQLRDDYASGEKAFLSGVTVASVGLLWMIMDAAFTGGGS